MSAKVIVLEGPDKVGKFTQAKMLVDALIKAGLKVGHAEVPVKSAFSHGLIYKMLKWGYAARFPNLFQFLHFVNRWIFQVFTLPRLLRENDYVVLDRWALSAIVYGDATGVNARFNRWLYSKMIRPDVTLVFVGERKNHRSDDEYEADSVLQRRVSFGYFDWVTSHSTDHELVFNHGSREDVHARVMCTLLHDGVLSRASVHNLTML